MIVGVVTSRPSRDSTVPCRLYCRCISSSATSCFLASKIAMSSDTSMNFLGAVESSSTNEFVAYFFRAEKMSAIGSAVCTVGSGSLGVYLTGPAFRNMASKCGSFPSASMLCVLSSCISGVGLFRAAPDGGLSS